MLVKAIYKDKNFDYFTDKENGLERLYGDIFECSDDLANERIKNKFVKKATKEEEKEYYANQTTVEDEDLENKDGFVVTQEDDGKVHVRPVVDGEILDTPVEKRINHDELEQSNND